MYLSNRINKWVVFASTCLLIIAACGTYLLLNLLGSQDGSDPKYVINQVRFKVSSIMLFLEQNHDIIKDNQHNKDTLRMMSEDSEVSLIFSQLDGKVLFNSDTINSIQDIDIKSSLHYDLYTAKVEKNLFKISFPVVDEKTQAQIGNAIFTIPKRFVFIEKSYTTQLTVFMIMISFLIILFILLIQLRNTIKQDMIQPVYKLKEYLEAILKGDYEKKAEYGKLDEIGEVYSIFDQMRQEIMYLNNQRDQHEKAQKELITNISHEIKTPLTTVKAYIDAVHEGVCSDMESVMGYIEVMQSNTDKMARLLEDLLMHAMKDLGQISVYPKEQYSRDILLKILKPISHHVRSTGVTFIEPKEIPNVLINVDATRLEQVIANLITNALKHSTNGDSIIFGIELDHKQLKIIISDTGEGISPEDVPFIFERYFRGGTDFTKYKNEGTGLGLSICKYIIEAHHGSISFKSQKSQGTTFHFTIPLC